MSLPKEETVEGSRFEEFLQALGELGIDPKKLGNIDIADLLPLLGVKAVEVPLAFVGDPLSPRELAVDEGENLQAAHALQDRLNKEAESRKGPGFLKNMYQQIDSVIKNDGRGWMYQTPTTAR